VNVTTVPLIEANKGPEIKVTLQEALSGSVAGGKT
jgi:hypothetical protein